MARILWKDPLTGEKAQFVADTLNEALFNYSFDSDKVPSLNLHFFCMDYLATYNLVEEGIMKDGNMQPLNEEFEYIINSSPWLPTGVSSSIMQFRNKQGYYKDIQKEKNIETKSRASYYKDSANYIIQLLSSNNGYINQLMSKIKTVLTSPVFTISEKQELYFCVRELISELINLGYSKEHLFNRVQTVLFSRRNSNDDVEFVMKFLESLLSNAEEYTVVFGISDELYVEFKELIEDVRQATEKEQEKLSANYVIETRINSVDPVSALRFSKKSYWLLINIHNACIHNDNMQILSHGFVRSKTSTKWTFIKDSINLLTKNKNKNKAERLHWTKIVLERNMCEAMLNSLSLHNNALKTEDAPTQLLTLWTIFEVLIDTEQSFMTRSNYVTNALCAVLCNSYYHRVLEALYNKIKQTTAVKTAILSESRGKNPIEKLAYILKDNTALQNSIISSLTPYPLEKYKFEYYITIFSSKEKMRSNLVRHSNRLRWQIMRIYRNRCMIVHNGDNLPYIENILENLHYYVDEVFNYIFSKFDIGIRDVEAIFSYARIVEGSNINLLGDKTKVLTDEEYCNLIFNY